MKPQKHGDEVLYRTYFGKALGVDEKGKLTLVRQYGLTDDKLFCEEVISDGIVRAAELAKKADAVIVCIGNDPMIVAVKCTTVRHCHCPHMILRLPKRFTAPTTNA